MVSKGDTPSGDTQQVLQLLPKHFGLLVSRDHQARRGASDLAGVIDSDYQEEANRQYSVTQWGMDKYVWKDGATWAYVSTPLLNGDSTETGTAAPA